MNLTVVVQPPFEPVSLQDAWQHLRLDPALVGSPGTLQHPDDAMLLRMISSSRIQCEQITHRTFVPQTLRITSRFPMSLATSTVAAASVSSSFLLFGPPLIEILSVSYYDSSNALVTTSDYYVTDDQVPQLCFQSPPAAFDRDDAFVVEYVAGYLPSGSPATTQEEYANAVPAHFRDAILLGVQLLYDELIPANRVAIENARMALLNSDITYTV